MKTHLIILALGALLAAPSVSHAQEPATPGAKAAPEAKEGNLFWVEDPMKRNIASFKSSAPLEDIVGTTNEVQGQLVFDPSKPEAGVRGEVRALVADLKTGIPLRDNHLAGKAWLDAESHPEIRFVIDGTRGVRLEKKGEGFSTWEMTLTGVLSLHGQEKRLEASAKVTYLAESKATRGKMPGNLLAGRAHFTVQLADFGVKGMKGVVGSKVSETIDVDISLIGSTVRPEAPKESKKPDQAPKGK